MMIRTYSGPIRKRPRPKAHKLQPILASMSECEHSDICDTCMSKYQTQVDNERPGHVWAVDDNKIIYLEDQIASAILGRPLELTEVAVHRNGDLLDNRRENIEIITIPDMGGK